MSETEMIYRSLDVGCGHSPQDNKKAEIGIDLEKGLCDIQASANDLPFQDQIFTKVVMSHVLEHLENFGLALEEVKRVLMKEGLLEIEVPNPCSFWVFKDNVKSRQPRLGGTGIHKDHVCSFSESEIQNTMRIKGFLTLSISYTHSSQQNKRMSNYNLIHKMFYQAFYKLFPAFKTSLKVVALKLK